MSTVAPRRSASFSVASKFARTPASIPASSSEPPRSSSGTPRRIPVRSWAVGIRIASGIATDVESMGSWPTMWESSSAPSVTLRVNGPA